jgi:hypothetical protein
MSYIRFLLTGMTTGETDGVVENGTQGRNCLKLLSTLLGELSVICMKQGLTGGPWYQHGLRESRQSCDLGNGGQGRCVLACIKSGLQTN